MSLGSRPHAFDVIVLNASCLIVTPAMRSVTPVVRSASAEGLNENGGFFETSSWMDLAWLIRVSYSALPGVANARAEAIATSASVKVGFAGLFFLVNSTRGSFQRCHYNACIYCEDLLEGFT